MALVIKFIWHQNMKIFKNFRLLTLSVACLQIVYMLDVKADSKESNDDKITICHYQGSGIKHTTHIKLSEWSQYTKKYPNDYLGSCNSQDPSATAEKMHVISGCPVDIRQQLLTKIQSFYDPIVVDDSSLDDNDMAKAMSQCLDNGDSSDSNKGNIDTRKTGGQGRGHDSVSDSGKHHYVTRCLNTDKSHKADSSKSKRKGRSDSDKDPNNQNFHKKLVAENIDNNSQKGLKSVLVVSDSSLNDSDVKSALAKCGSNSGNLSVSKGDSGHKYRRVKDCSNDNTLKAALDAYKSKAQSDSNKQIIVTDTAYNDASILPLIQKCSGDQVTSGIAAEGAAGSISWREITTPPTSVDPVKEALAQGRKNASAKGGTVK